MVDHMESVGEVEIPLGTKAAALFEGGRSNVTVILRHRETENIDLNVEEIHRYDPNVEQYKITTTAVHPDVQLGKMVITIVVDRNID